MTQDLGSHILQGALSYITDPAYNNAQIDAYTEEFKNTVEDAVVFGTTSGSRDRVLYNLFFHGVPAANISEIIY